MVEKVVQANFFHHFREKKTFLRNSWKKWKKLSPTFSPTQAVLEAQIVEKVGFTNNFQDFATKFMETIGFRAGSTAKTYVNGGVPYIYIYIYRVNNMIP